MNERAGHDSLADKQYPMVLLAAIAGCALIFLGLVFCRHIPGCRY